MRVVAGAGAWLLGVGAATAGSLLAVSLLGQGIATSTGQQLTAAAVSRALGAEATETDGPGQPPAASPSPSPSATRSHQVGPDQVQPETQAGPSAQASSSRPASSPAAQPTAAAAPASTARVAAGAAPAAPTPAASAPAVLASTVLTSVGGSVVAECRPGGAYLVSWSPVPGYEAGTVIRGPAATAQVTFNSTANSVTMVVSCSAGAPTATSTVGGPGSGGDDGVVGRDR
jgi:hypothetical protein